MGQREGGVCEVGQRGRDGAEREECVGWGREGGVCGVGQRSWPARLHI